MQKRSKRLALRVLSTATFLAMVSSCTTAAFADTYDLTKGSVTVNAKSDGISYVTQTDSDGKYVYDNNHELHDYKDETPVTLTTSGEEPTHNTASIYTEKGVSTTVTLDNVNIDASDTGKAAISTDGKVTLELDGNNTLIGGEGHAALEKSSNVDTDHTLTLQDKTTDETTGEGKTGSLTATGGAGGAGIGASADKNHGYADYITITGGAGGAGIGGGKGDGGYHSGQGLDITVKDGAHVEATGGAGGAGIGGGDGSAGGEDSGLGNQITITGEGTTVKANGNAGGAGIGGGIGGGGQNITVTGGIITANGSAGGAGIGSGNATAADQTNLPRAAVIQISGGTVTANGGADGGAGIGGGKGTAASVRNGGNGVTITDGTVTANGGKGAAGIGSGADSGWKRGSFVDITGGTVTATGGAGEAAGIGNGENDAGTSTVKISATNAVLDVTAVTQGSGEAITGENGVTMASLTNERSGVVRFFRSTNHYNTVHNGKYVGMDDNNADEHKKTDAHIWDSAKDEILQQATPAVRGIVRHHCEVDGCKGYYDEPFDYVAPAEPVTPAPTDPDTPDVPGTSDVTPGTPAQDTPDVPDTSDVAPGAPAQDTPDVPGTLDVTPDAPADAVAGAAAAKEVSVTPSRAQSIIAAALPQTGVNWLVAAVGSALSGMFLLAVGFVLKHKSRGQN